MQQAIASTGEWQGQNIQAPSTAVAGGAITITVGTGDDVVEVGIAGSPNMTPYPAPASKTVTIPVPPAAPGAIIVIRVGKGLRTRLAYVTVTAP